MSLDSFDILFYKDFNATTGNNKPKDNDSVLGISTGYKQR